jgi:hypothetical protein
MASKKIIDQILDSLRPGDLTAEGTLKIVRGPFKSEDDVCNKEHESCWHSANKWYAVVPVEKPKVKEGMDDADDGSPLEVTGPSSVSNDLASWADQIENSANRLSGIIDRRANYRNPRLLKKLIDVSLILTEIHDELEDCEHRER